MIFENNLYSWKNFRVFAGNKPLKYEGNDIQTLGKVL